MKKYRKNNKTAAIIVYDQTLMWFFVIFSNQSYLAAIIPTLNIIKYCGKNPKGKPKGNLSTGERRRNKNVPNPKTIAIRSK